MRINLEYDTPKIRKWDGMAISSTIVSASSPIIAVFGLSFLHTPLILALWFGPALLAAILGFGGVIRIKGSVGQLRGIYFASAGIAMALLWLGFVVWVLTHVMFD